MLGDEKNGNDGKPEEEKAAVPEEVKVGKEEPKLNRATIESGVMTVTLYLEGPDNSFAAAIGSLVLSQDMVRNYFAQKMIVEQAQKAQMMSKIIRPGLVN